MELWLKLFLPLSYQTQKIFLEKPKTNSIFLPKIDHKNANIAFKVQKAPDPSMIHLQLCMQNFIFFSNCTSLKGY